MRKVFMIGLCLLVAGIIGCSKGSQEVEASGGDACSSYLGYVLNKCDPHPAQYKRRNQVGAGVDLLLWKNEKVEVNQQTRLDWNNGLSNGGLSTYTVVEPQLEEGVLQTAGKKIKGLWNKLFNKGE